MMFFRILIAFLLSIHNSFGQFAELTMPKAIIEHKLIHDNFFIERGYCEIYLTKTKVGQYLVPIKIKGKKLMFLLDTGANGSGIRGTIADSLGAVNK